MASSPKPAPDDLAEHVARVLAPRIRPEQRLTVALSGGADSVALLHVLAGLAGRFGWRLSALHVHHGLSPDADAWEAGCRALCGRLGVSLAVRRVAVDPRAALGLEAAAREARYREFARFDTDVVALAHHRDDQVETLLLQLLRGAGPRGVAGMGSERTPRGSAVRIVRPLLDVPRSRLRAYAAAHALAWADDESNADPRRARAFVRHAWLPAARQRFPGADAALARSARLQAEAAVLLEDLAAIDAAGAIEPGRLALARLAALTPPRARNLLRHFLARHGVAAPPQRRLAEFLRQAGTVAADTQMRLDLPGWHLFVWRGAVWLVPAAAPAAALAWRGEASLALGGGRGELRFHRPAGAGLAARRVELEGLGVRWRVGGERLQLSAGGPRCRLKTLLQERDIPPWMRGRLPLVFVGERLAWVAGVGVAEGFAAGAGEAGIEPEWVPPPGFGADGRPLTW